MPYATTNQSSKRTAERAHEAASTLLVNLWHLKSKNGMFYYALDYARSLGAPVLLLTNRRLDLGEEFRDLNAVKIGLIHYIRMFPRLTQSAVFTPTPHPLPFVDRQLIVVHDSYPFNGFAGRFKSMLLRLSLATSRCKVAFINRTDSRRFVDRIVSAPGRKLFLPNHLPAKLDVERPQRCPDQLTIGLVGTDSPKKNYDDLLNVVAKANSLSLRFVVYGADTAYFRGLASRFPEARLQLMPSSENDFAKFFSAIDCLVSVATNEGFSRPVASALQSGVPCLLRRDEVFVEFYDGAARIYPTITDLVADLRPDKELPRARGINNALELQAAIDSGTAVLRNLCVPSTADCSS